MSSDSFDLPVSCDGRVLLLGLRADAVFGELASVAGRAFNAPQGGRLTDADDLVFPPNELVAEWTPMLPDGMVYFLPNKARTPTNSAQEEEQNTETNQASEEVATESSPDIATAVSARNGTFNGSGNKHSVALSLFSPTGSSTTTPPSRRASVLSRPSARVVSIESCLWRVFSHYAMSGSAHAHPDHLTAQMMFKMLLDCEVATKAVVTTRPATRVASPPAELASTTATSANASPSPAVASVSSRSPHLPPPACTPLRRSEVDVIYAQTLRSAYAASFPSSHGRTVSSVAPPGVVGAASRMTFDLFCHALLRVAIRFYGEEGIDGVESKKITYPMPQRIWDADAYAGLLERLLCEHVLVRAHRWEEGGGAVTSGPSSASALAAAAAQEDTLANDVEFQSVMHHFESVFVLMFRVYAGANEVSARQLVDSLQQQSNDLLSTSFLSTSLAAAATSTTLSTATSGSTILLTWSQWQSLCNDFRLTRLLVTPADLARCFVLSSYERVCAVGASAASEHDADDLAASFYSNEARLRLTLAEFVACMGRVALVGATRLKLHARPALQAKAFFSHLHSAVSGSASNPSPATTASKAAGDSQPVRMADQARFAKIVTKLRDRYLAMWTRDGKINYFDPVALQRAAATLDANDASANKRGTHPSSRASHEEKQQMPPTRIIVDVPPTSEPQGSPETVATREWTACLARDHVFRALTRAIARRQDPQRASLALPSSEVEAARRRREQRARERNLMIASPPTSSTPPPAAAAITAPHATPMLLAPTPGSPIATSRAPASSAGGSAPTSSSTSSSATAPSSSPSATFEKTPFDHLMLFPRRRGAATVALSPPPMTTLEARIASRSLEAVQKAEALARRRASRKPKYSGRKLPQREEERVARIEETWAAFQESIKSPEAAVQPPAHAFAVKKAPTPKPKRRPSASPTRTKTTTNATNTSHSNEPSPYDDEPHSSIASQWFAPTVEVPEDELEADSPEPEDDAVSPLQHSTPAPLLSPTRSRPTALQLPGPASASSSVHGSSPRARTPSRSPVRSPSRSPHARSPQVPSSPLVQTAEASSPRTPAPATRRPSLAPSTTSRRPSITPAPAAAAAVTAQTLERRPSSSTSTPVPAPASVAPAPVASPARSVRSGSPSHSSTVSRSRSRSHAAREEDASSNHNDDDFDVFGDLANPLEDGGAASAAASVSASPAAPPSQQPSHNGSRVTSRRPSVSSNRPVTGPVTAAATAANSTAPTAAASRRPSAPSSARGSRLRPRGNFALDKGEEDEDDDDDDDMALWDEAPDHDSHERDGIESTTPHEQPYQRMSRSDQTAPTAGQSQSRPRLPSNKSVSSASASVSRRDALAAALSQEEEDEGGDEDEFPDLATVEAAAAVSARSPPSSKKASTLSHRTQQPPHDDEEDDDDDDDDDYELDEHLHGKDEEEEPEPAPVASRTAAAATRSAAGSQKSAPPPARQQSEDDFEDEEDDYGSAAEEGNARSRTPTPDSAARRASEARARQEREAEEALQQAVAAKRAEAAAEEAAQARQLAARESEAAEKARIANVVQQGDDFLKYSAGIFGPKSNKRFVRVSSHGNKLFWGKDAHSLEKSIVLRDITEVKEGATSKALSKLKPAQTSLAFSIMSPTKVLNLVAETAKQRDDWIRFLRQFAPK